jgi:hypothetical protein
MRVLVVVERSPKHRFLVRLHDEALVREVKALVNKKRYALAMVTALSEGIFEKEFAAQELPDTKVRLILSEDGANWDLKD